MSEPGTEEAFWRILAARDSWATDRGNGEDELKGSARDEKENQDVILLVEDNASDVRLIQEALRECGAPERLHVAGDGEQAIAFLKKGKGQYDAPTPALILLDLNLPRKDGREVLAEIKGDERLRRIPVVVLTTSTSEEDVIKSYNLHANCYVTKPIELEKFIGAIQSIRDFWMTTVTLPSVTP